MTRPLLTTESQPATLTTEDGNPFSVIPGPDEPGPPGGGPLYSVVLRPGDTSGDPNVFTSWASLYAACSAIPGGVRVNFDDSQGAIHLTAGGPYNIDGWQWVNGAGAATLIIDVGATATWRNLYIDGMTIALDNTAAFFSSLHESNTYILDGTIITATTTGPLIESPNGADLAFVTIYPSCAIGDGTHAVFVCDTGGNLEIFQSGGEFDDNGLTGPGTLAFDNSVSIDATAANFPGGVTFFPISRLGLVATNNAPGIAAGAQLGTGGAVALGAGSNDAAGVISVTAGTGNAAGNQAVLTFSQAYTSAPRAVLLSAANVTAASAVASGTEVYTTAVSAAGFTLACVNGIIGGGAHEYAYVVIV